MGLNNQSVVFEDNNEGRYNFMYKNYLYVINFNNGDNNNQQQYYMNDLQD